mmetsp:Transcript_83379/g.131249  ORF Transcript_83379/g.131249 Transcript_83379/m.131249 type:complete len:80 (+) Transcript_83379:294-533(+)
MNQIALVDLLRVVLANPCFRVRARYAVATALPSLLAEKLLAMWIEAGELLSASFVMSLALKAGIHCQWLHKHIKVNAAM